MTSLQGLPTLTAPGEAEAAAGALNAAGHVDAAGTPDGDVLLFGATEVFHTLKLLVSLIVNCSRKLLFTAHAFTLTWHVHPTEVRKL
jgi:5'-3' exonuclease